MTRFLISVLVLSLASVWAQEWPRLSVGPTDAEVALNAWGKTYIFGSTKGSTESRLAPPGTENAVFAETGELIVLRGAYLEVADAASLRTLRRTEVPQIKNPVQPYRLATAADIVVVGGSIPLEVANPQPSFYVFALDSLEQLGSFTASGTYSGLADLELTQDGKTLVGASGDGTMRFWDVQTGRETQTTYLFAHGYAVSLSPDDTFVAAPYGEAKVTGAAKVRVWDFASGQLVADLEGLANVTDIEMTQRGDVTLLAATGGQRYKVWSLPKGETLLEGTVSESAAVTFLFGEQLLLGLRGALVTLPLP